MRPTSTPQSHILRAHVHDRLHEQRVGQNALSPTEPQNRTVAEAMLGAPKTLPMDATLADVYHVLNDDHVHMALLVSGDRLVGTVTRADLDVTGASGDRTVPALPVAGLQGRTVAPEASLEVVRMELVATARRRLAVVDAAGRLLGLLCLKRTGEGFCTDLDVASREAAAVRVVDVAHSSAAEQPERHECPRSTVASR